MSDERKDTTGGPVSPEDQRLLDRLRQEPRPTAPRALRERARSAFVDGGLASPPVESTPALSPRRARTWPALVAVAALLAVAVIWWGGQPGEVWTVTDVVARTGVNIEKGCGNPGEHVHPGTLATSDTSQIEIQLGFDIRLRLLEGTRIQVPEAPGRWFGGSPTLTLEAGEVYGTTRGPLPYTLVLATGEATAHLQGTTFAVFRTDEATCFCLLDGSLRVEPAGQEALELPVGNRVFVYRDGRAPTIESLSDMERDKLTMTRDAGVMDPLPVHP